MRPEETIRSALASTRCRKVSIAFLVFFPILFLTAAYGYWEWGLRKVDTNQTLVIASLARSIHELYGIDDTTLIRQIESEFDVHSIGSLSQRQYRCIVERLSRWMASGLERGS